MAEVTLDLAHLRALALAATPGPWDIDGEGITHCTDQAGDEWATLACAWVDWFDPDNAQALLHWENGADAAYIAAMNPQQTLALLDEVERLESCNRADRLNFEAQRQRRKDVEQERDRLREKLCRFDVPLGPAQELSRLSQERDRLREALEEIGSESCPLVMCCNAKHPATRHPCNACIARAALSAPEGQGRDGEGD